jgi:hypothetical protein
MVVVCMYRLRGTEDSDLSEYIRYEGKKTLLEEGNSQTMVKRQHKDAEKL